MFSGKGRFLGQVSWGKVSFEFPRILKVLKSYIKTCSLPHTYLPMYFCHISQILKEFSKISRTLNNVCVAIVQSLIHVQLFATPWK